MVTPVASRSVNATAAFVAAAFTTAKPVARKSVESMTLAKLSVDCASKGPELKNKLTMTSNHALIGQSTALHYYNSFRARAILLI
jgi:hypothetical protein